MRERLGSAKSIQEMKEICQTLKERTQKDIEENSEPETTVIPYWRCQPYIRSNSGVKRSLDEMKKDEERIKEVVKLRQTRKALKKQKVQARRERSWDICSQCEVNPKGLKCSFSFCRVCCRDRKTDGEAKHCPAHRIKATRLKEDDSSTKERNEVFYFK